MHLTWNTDVKCHFDVGKMSSALSAKGARCKKYKSFMRNITGSKITCFWTSTFKQWILTINQYKEWSFDRICKVQLSDEKKILMDKSILERYRKYKCCVFIDFEYICKLMKLGIRDSNRTRIDLSFPGWSLLKFEKKNSSTEKSVRSYLKRNQ